MKKSEKETGAALGDEGGVCVKLQLVKQNPNGSSE